MNPKYRLLAKKYCDEAIKKFYDNNNKIFQKNEKSKNDIFTSPIDISDNTLPNANSIMLINFSRLGYTPRVCILAKLFGAKKIDFIGIDGFKDNNSYHYFEVNLVSK